jgi:RNA polymerase sigma-70 factor (ECF subfamily)
MASSDDKPGKPSLPPGSTTGDPLAPDAISATLYGELRRLAAGHLRRERSGHTLQPTALVHEAYIRLAKLHQMAWHNRAQVLGVAAHLMRRILVDHARARGRVKRAGQFVRVTFDGLEVGAERPRDLVALDDALRELAAIDEQLSRIVELRYFGGLTVEEVAELLETSPRSVDRAWATARTWLRRCLESSETP